MILFISIANLIGYYKHPYDCDHTIVGACQYLIMWFKTALNDEIRFAIAARNVVRTEVGFSKSTSAVSIFQTDVYPLIRHSNGSSKCIFRI